MWLEQDKRRTYLGLLEVEHPAWAENAGDLGQHAVLRVEERRRERQAGVDAGADKIGMQISITYQARPTRRWLTS